MKRSILRSGVGGLLVFAPMLGCFVGPVFANHSRLHEVLEFLRTAREVLSSDEHSYGGHREKALHRVEESIHEVREAIKHEK